MNTISNKRRGSANKRFKKRPLFSTPFLSTKNGDGLSVSNFAVTFLGSFCSTRCGSRSGSRSGPALVPKPVCSQVPHCQRRCSCVSFATVNDTQETSAGAQFFALAFPAGCRVSCSDDIIRRPFIPSIRVSRSSLPPECLRPIENQRRHFFGHWRQDGMRAQQAGLVRCLPFPSQRRMVRVRQFMGSPALANVSCSRSRCTIGALVGEARTARGCFQDLAMAFFSHG